MDINRLGTIVAILVGIFGVTHSIFLILRELMKERRKLIIYCEETSEKWTDKVKGESSQAIAIKQLAQAYDALTIRAINNSQRPIVIVAAGFYLDNGKKIEKTGEDIGLPRRIEDGESVTVPFGILWLQRELAEQFTKPNIAGRIFRNIRTFWDAPAIGDYKFRSPFFFDY